MILHLWKVIVSAEINSRKLYMKHLHSPSLLNPNISFLKCGFPDALISWTGKICNRNSVLCNLQHTTLNILFYKVRKFSVHSTRAFIQSQLSEVKHTAIFKCWQSRKRKMNPHASLMKLSGEIDTYHSGFWFLKIFFPNLAKEDIILSCSPPNDFSFNQI